MSENTQTILKSIVSNNIIKNSIPATVKQDLNLINDKDTSRQKYFNYCHNSYFL